MKANSIKTDVPAIFPLSENIFNLKLPAAIFMGNGFGKLAGYGQVKEFCNFETPIILTNILNIPTASDALITYTLNQDITKNVQSVNSVVGETNDGYHNDISGRHIKEKHVLNAIENAKIGKVAEGNVGAGTGTICFRFKDDIGTSSRAIQKSKGGYIVSVLVQTIFGGVLEINGAPIAKELNSYPYKNDMETDGSCMIVIITDAPIGSRNLERVAKRAMLWLAKTGGIASNGSGDYVIALSTAKENLIESNSDSTFHQIKELKNSEIIPILLATIEATEEAIINSLFAAENMIGRDKHEIKELTIDDLLKIMKKYNKIKE